MKSLHFFFLTFLVINGCFLNRSEVSPGSFANANALFAYGKQLYTEGKYKRAIEVLKEFTLKFPSSSRIDSAEFLLAESYRRAHLYDEAISEFMFFIDNFPGSPLIVKAYLRLAQVYLEKSPSPQLDQEDTYKSIELLRSFLSKFQNTHAPLLDSARFLLKKAKDKLAQKFIIAAKTYRDLGDFRSERFYLNLLFKEYPESSAIWEGKYLLLEYYLKKNYPDSAKNVLQEILNSSEAPPLIVRKSKILGLKHKIWPFEVFEQKGGFKG